MCEPTTIALTMAAVSTVAQGYQARQQGRLTESRSKFDARQLENQATRTLNKGTEEENKQRRATAELISKQRAQLGAANVDIGSGSALQLQQDAATLGEVDALRIRSNFGDEAAVLQDTALITRATGKAARKAGDTQFTTALLGSGIAAAGVVNSKWLTPSSSANITQVGTGQQFAAFA